MNFILINTLKTVFKNGSRRFIVNSYTLHPPNHNEIIAQKVKQIKVEPVELTNSKGEWVGFPQDYTERHFKKFEEVKQIREQFDLHRGGWGC